MVKNADGSVQKVLVKVITNVEKKVKGVIHWVSKEHAVSAIVNQYANLLTCENVAEQSKKDGRPWTSYFNEQSLVKYLNAKIWDFHADAKEYDRF